MPVSTESGPVLTTTAVKHYSSEGAAAIGTGAPLLLEGLATPGSISQAAFVSRKEVAHSAVSAIHAHFN